MTLSVKKPVCLAEFANSVCIELFVIAEVISHLGTIFFAKSTGYSIMCNCFLRKLVFQADCPVICLVLDVSPGSWGEQKLLCQLDTLEMLCLFLRHSGTVSLKSPGSQAPGLLSNSCLCMFRSNFAALEL